MNASTNTKNVTREDAAKAEFARLLSATQIRGFHGMISIIVSLQDGHIQHLRISTERMVR